ncbi:MAG: lipopolysaccharide biosynthesis protein [Actinomycetota bacterium]|nr:lipopolysaccharide biosynthesis protein [Actinomycetota bacterium]
MSAERVEAASAAPSLGIRTLRGTAWAYASYIGGQAIVLASTALLARILSPAEFGLVALALVFITLLDTVSDLGLGPALVISSEEALRDRANTVFALTVLIGAVLSALTAAIAPLAALVFHQPELVPLLAVLGLNFLLRSFGATHYAVAQKRIDFRSRTAAELAGVVVRGGTGITLALAGFGAWSLVVGYLAGTVAVTATLWSLVPWRPSGRPSRVRVPAMLRFGTTLTGVDVLAAVISQVDYVFVARVLGTQALGLYTLGFRLPEMLIISLAVVAGRVLFPAFAAVEREELRRVFLVSVRYAAIVAFPLAAGLAALAEPFVLALFGDRWHGSIAAMRVLSLYAPAVAIGIPAGIAYKATGEAAILLKLAVPRTVLVVVSIALFVREGIVAVAACQAGVASLFALIGFVIASRMLRVTATEFVSTLLPPLLSASGMAVVALSLAAVIDSPTGALAVAVPASALSYFGLLWVVAPDVNRDLRERIAGALQRA